MISNIHRHMDEPLRQLMIDSVFKGVFQKWNDQQRCNLLFLDMAVDSKTNVDALVLPQLFQVQIVAQVVDLLTKRNLLLVAFIEHVPHHLGQLDDNIRCFI